MNNWFSEILTEVASPYRMGNLENYVIEACHSNKPFYEEGITMLQLTQHAMSMPSGNNIYNYINLY